MVNYDSACLFRLAAWANFIRKRRIIEYVAYQTPKQGYFIMVGLWISVRRTGLAACHHSFRGNGFSTVFRFFQI